MSDANFINAYNEVILDNITAIMKQNFMFQTQMKFLEERVSKIPEMEQKLASVESDKSIKQEEYSRLMNEKNNLANEVSSLKHEIEDKNRIIQNNVTTDNDKHRLQTAVNQQAGEILIRVKNILHSWKICCQIQKRKN
jgi:predicted nuclease with TOPRIM domain